MLPSMLPDVAYGESVKSSMAFASRLRLFKRDDLAI
jgi:hypothetical protein